MSELGSAALGAGVSGLFGLVGSAMNYGFQKKLAAQQNEYNLDMWKMQAEYNSPQAQMQRFSEAGLNPNLIYGQGSDGNMANAPQMVTPQSPDVSKDMRELGKLFNVENLRTLVANRKKAEAEAKDAQINANRNADQYDAEWQLGGSFQYDPVSGMFVPTDGTSYFDQSLYRSNFWQMINRAKNFQMNYLRPAMNSINTANALMRGYDWSHYPKTFWLDKATLKNPIGIGAALWHYINEYRRTGKAPSF